MWIAVFITMIASLIGYQSMLVSDSIRIDGDSEALAMAASMAAYRAAVITYANAHPGSTSMVISDGELGPFALTGYQQASSPHPRWTNYSASDGTIVIYPLMPLPFNITAALGRLSQHSVLAGAFDAGTNKLVVPGMDDNDEVTLPDQFLASAMPADGTPVWLGHRD